VTHPAVTALAPLVRDGWGSHIPALVAALVETTGPVLEIRAGHFSTPLLHSLCAAAGRELLTVEGDAQWCERFESLETESHEIRHVASANGIALALGEREWGLVFVDNAPDEARKFALLSASALTSAVIVCHDAQRVAYRKGLASFASAWTHAPTGMPATAVVSQSTLPTAIGGAA
jgi:hypothetical protein